MCGGQTYETCAIFIEFDTTKSYAVRTWLEWNVIVSYKRKAWGRLREIPGTTFAIDVHPVRMWPPETAWQWQ